MFFKLALSKSVVTNAIKVSLVVGSVLVAINHGDAIMNNEINLERALKIGLNYLVPYLVASYSAVKALQQQLSK